MGKRHFTVFEFKLRFGRISYSAQHIWFEESLLASKWLNKHWERLQMRCRLKYHYNTTLLYSKSTPHNSPVFCEFKAWSLSHIWHIHAYACDIVLNSNVVYQDAIDVSFEKLVKSTFSRIAGKIGNANGPYYVCVSGLFQRDVNPVSKCKKVIKSSLHFHPYVF